jgi:outer membrane protein, heavy metal efflux system
MPPKGSYRASLCACALAISLSAHAAELTYNAADRLATAPNLALAVLVRDVLDSNPGVLAAHATVEAAQARTRAANKPLYNPELTLDLEQAAEDIQALGLNQAIDWADKRGARAEVAAFERAATSAQLATVRQNLAGKLLSALARFQTARELARLARQRTHLMQRFASLSQQRHDAGDLNQVGLEVAKLAYAQARLQRAQAATDVLRARQGLAAVVGEIGRDWPALPTELPTIAKSVTDIEALLSDLPLLRAYRARMAAARAAVELQVRQRRPDPILGLRGGREEGEALIGLNLSLPLFVRNTFSAEVDVANANLIRIQRQAQNAYRRAKARLVSALGQYRLTQSAWRNWQAEGQRSLKAQIELLRRLWEAGAVSATNFLVQLNQALSTRSSVIALRGRAWQAWFDWLVASGQIGTWLGLRWL